MQSILQMLGTKLAEVMRHELLSSCKMAMMD